MLRVEGAGVTTVDGQYYDAGLVDGLRAYEKTNPNGSVVRVSLYNNTAALAASKAAALEAAAMATSDPDTAEAAFRAAEEAHASSPPTSPKSGEFFQWSLSFRTIPLYVSAGRDIEGVWTAMEGREPPPRVTLLHKLLHEPSPGPDMRLPP
jgi:hypothetical protein